MLFLFMFFWVVVKVPCIFQCFQCSQLFNELKICVSSLPMWILLKYSNLLIHGWPVFAPRGFKNDAFIKYLRSNVKIMICLYALHWDV